MEQQQRYKKELVDEYVKLEVLKKLLIEIGDDPPLIDMLTNTHIHIVKLKQHINTLVRFILSDF